VKLIARSPGAGVYHLLLPTEVGANSAATTIRQMGHHVDIGRSQTPGSWEVVVQTRASSAPEIIGRTRRTLGVIAEVLGGRLEGFEVDIA
jgi:hypothetical protein